MGSGRIKVAWESPACIQYTNKLGHHFIDLFALQHVSSTLQIRLSFQKIDITLQHASSILNKLGHHLIDFTPAKAPLSHKSNSNIGWNMSWNSSVCLRPYPSGEGLFFFLKAPLEERHFTTQECPRIFANQFFLKTGWNWLQERYCVHVPCRKPDLLTHSVKFVFELKGFTADTTLKYANCLRIEKFHSR